MYGNHMLTRKGWDWYLKCPMCGGISRANNDSLDERISVASHLASRQFPQGQMIFSIAELGWKAFKLTPFVGKRCTECGHEYDGDTKFVVQRHSEVEAKVIKIVAEILSVDPSSIKLESSAIEDLGADSLDVVELCLALEEEFGVEIPDDAAESLQTVGDAVNFLGKIAST